jgi:hypothetical protein
VIKRQHGAWDIEYLVEERDSGSEVIAVHITPHGCPLDDCDKWPIHGIDSPALTRRELRDFPLGPAVIPRQVVNPEEMDAAGVRLPKPMARERRRPDSFYAQVMRLYVAACDRDDRAPRVTVARQLSANGIPCSSSSIRDFRKEAERRGLITQTRPGKSGGKLTEKAIRLLDE